MESGNKLVVEARLKGSGMHWHERHANPMLALRTMICYKRWKQEWSRIETRLRHKRPPQKAPSTAPAVLTEMEALALILKEKLGNDPVPWSHHHRKEEPVPGKISSMAKLFTSKRGDFPKLSTTPLLTHPLEITAKTL